jgi:hypothetical protein
MVIFYIRRRLVQRDGRQIVLCGLEKGRGTVVGQQDGRAIGAEQGPEIEARVEVRRFRKYAGNVFLTHLPDIADLARAEMREFIPGHATRLCALGDHVKNSF